MAIVDAPIAVTGQDDASKAEWWSLSDLPHLAFGHYDIMPDAIEYFNWVVYGHDFQKTDSHITI